MDPRCEKCGETRLIEVTASPSGQIRQTVCSVCSHVGPLITESRVVTCPACQGVGSHEDCCPTLQNLWGH